MLIKNGELENIELLVFDIDQTLVDFDRFEELVERIFKEENVKMPVNYLKKYVDAVWDAMKLATDEPVFNFDYIARVLVEKNLDKIDPVHFFRIWLKEEGNHVKMIPGAQDCLDKLSKHYRIVSSTNWFLESQIRKLQKFDMFKYFSKIYTCENIQAKPNDLNYLRVLKAENIDPSKVVMIGDSEPDIPNKELGIRNILFDENQNKYHLYDKSDIVITELSDLPKILLKQKKDTSK